MYPNNSGMPSYEMTTTAQPERFVNSADTINNAGINEHVNAAYKAYDDRPVNPVNMSPEERSALGAAAQFSSETSVPLAAQPTNAEQINNPDMYNIAVIGNNLTQARQNAMKDNFGLAA